MVDQHQRPLLGRLNLPHHPRLEDSLFDEVARDFVGLRELADRSLAEVSVAENGGT